MAYANILAALFEDLPLGVLGMIYILAKAPTSVSALPDGLSNTVGYGGAGTRNGRRSERAF